MRVLSALSLNPYRKRIEWIDAARALAMFVIIYAHTYSSSTISGFVHLFHVPIFFFLSGLVWREKGKTLKTFLTDSFVSLLAPYYICAVLSICVYLLLGRFVSDGEKTLPLIRCVEGMLYANSRTGLMAWNRPLWFIPCLFSVRLLWQLIVRFVKDERIRGLLVAILVAGGVMLSYQYGDLKLPYELEIAFVMLGYFFLGTKADILKKGMGRARAFELVVVAALSLAACIVVFRFNRLVSVQNSYYGNFLLFAVGSFAGIAMILSFAGLLAKSLQAKGILLQFIGQNTLSILLWHKFPVLLYQVSPIGKKALEQPDSVVSILLALTVIAVTTAVCLAVAWCFGKVERLVMRQNETPGHN